MPIHNDEVLFTLQAFVDGCKLNGTGTDGRRAQFSFGAIILAVRMIMDAIHFNNAQGVGQLVIGNMPGVAASTAPGINDDSPFMGTLNTFPATDDTHIDFIVQKKTRS
ncbi:MAG: hypothetical protein AB3N18_04530 [Allomuricauda sp.]